VIAKPGKGGVVVAKPGKGGVLTAEPYPGGGCPLPALPAPGKGGSASGPTKGHGGGTAPVWGRTS